MEFFDKELLPVFLTMLTDPVNAVRMAATRCLTPLTAVLGAEWVASRLEPKLSSLYHAEGCSYLTRITVLYAARDALLGGSEGGASGSSSSLVPLLLGALSDPVSNVRFIAASVLGEAAKHVPRSLLEATIRPALSSLLAKDTDNDVKFFSALALERVAEVA